MDKWWKDPKHGLVSLTEEEVRMCEDRAGLDRDSENVKAYEGGSFRDRPPGRGIFHVIPPILIKRLASRYEYGDVKYGKTDAFKDGLPVSDCIDSIYRHLLDYIDGDNREDHLAAIVWNVAAIMYYETTASVRRWCDLRTRRGIPMEECETYPLPKKGLDATSMDGSCITSINWKEYSDD